MITEQQLALLLEAAYDIEADVVTTPAEARKRFAEKQAAAIAAFVIGRPVAVETSVVGVTGEGVSVTGTGTGTGIITEQ